jgi:serine phosphatase RsbU (regulator of sigma subunit)
MARFLLPAPERVQASGLVTRLKNFLLGTWRGRVLSVALVLWLLDSFGLPLPVWLAGPARLVVFLAVLVCGWRLTRLVLRLLLYKIRSKLLLSYLFIAVVPVVLLVLFFFIAALFFSGVVASHLVNAELERQSERLEEVGRRALDELGHDPAALAAALPARVRELHPQAGWSLLCAGRPPVSKGGAPESAPNWWQAPRFSGLVARGEGDALRVGLRARSCVLFLDAPLDERLLQGLEARLGIRYLTTVGDMEVREHGVTVEVDDDEPPRADRARSRSIRAQASSKGMTFMAPLMRTEWDSGKTSDTGMLFQFAPWELLRHLTPGPLNLAERLLQALAVVGVIFLLMYGVALLFGGLLARSITRSVYALSHGTQLIRQGDFEHRIAIKSRDQLGDLAESFNLMAGGIQDLLRQQGEKERLEEELRIARQIQMSLLPQHDVELHGLRVAALCLPAAEVGGDYYDLLPLSDKRLGVLVADVSGKGTSAALYMAELKGLVLSLSRIYDSPARLLAEANRILADNLDSRSFITMTYAVVDLQAGRMRFARAGHNPLIRLEAKSGRTQILAPPGMGLGLDRGEHFERVLEEAEVPLETGDLLVFFTDGLSEAMNPQAELFGEQRLRDVIAGAEGLSSEELKERILGEIRTFVGAAAQHDDMTLVILKVL